MTTQPDRKILLRRVMRERMLAIDPKDLRAWSSDLRRVVDACPAFGRARTILAFWPTMTSESGPAVPEPDIRPLLDRALARGVRVCLPRIDWQAKTLTPAQILDPNADLTLDRFGLSVPTPACPAVDLAELDAVLVPGLAFDAIGHRLGRGGGFYDRLLARLDRPRVACLGVCFETQLLADIPSTTHDMRVDRILTESREIRIG